MILLTTQGGFLYPFCWVLGKIFNGLFELVYLVSSWFTDEPWRIPIVAIAVILFTVVVRLLLLPLTIKQQKFSKLQNIMNPEVQAIQAKYKDKKDQASMMKMNEETKAVYEKYGASPSGGCLVMIIQLPIMFALYRVIYKIPGYVSRIGVICSLVASMVIGTGTGVWNSEDTETGFKGIFSSVEAEITEDNTEEDILKNVIDKIYNLSTANWEIVNDQIGDSVLEETDIEEAKLPADQKTVRDVSNVIQGYNSLFGLNLMESPGWKPSLAWLIPLLAGLAQWLSAKLMENKNKVVTGKESDQQQGMAGSMKMMNTIMPIISAVFCITLPACIGLYWIASSVCQIVIQLFINKKMDHIDVEEMVQNNIDKVNAKRAKKGLPPKKITNSATSYVEQVKKQEERDARRGEREEEIRKSTDYYASKNTAKPGSLAAKANMVKMFNERNNSKKNDE